MLPSELDELSPRELEVLRLMAAGKSNREIAEALFISLNTVATHVRNILTKTACANRTEAAAYAMRHGLTER
jgi:NarL family two-component system response regulator LiaR